MPAGLRRAYVLSEWVWNLREPRGGKVMEFDLLDLYGRASDWTGTKVRGAVSTWMLPRYATDGRSDLS